jgi:hypothetical protein
MLRVSTQWQSDGTSVSMLVEGMSRNKCFVHVRISTVLHQSVSCLLTLPLTCSVRSHSHCGGHFPRCEYVYTWGLVPVLAASVTRFVEYVRCIRIRSWAIVAEVDRDVGLKWPPGKWSARFWDDMFMLDCEDISFHKPWFWAHAGTSDQILPFVNRDKWTLVVHWRSIRSPCLWQLQAFFVHYEWSLQEDSAHLQFHLIDIEHRLSGTSGRLR